MIVLQLDIPELFASALVVVLEPENLRRMQKGDPCTLESGKSGGSLRPPTYHKLAFLIAYEPDLDLLYRMARENDSIGFIRWLCRGQKGDASEGGVSSVLDFEQVGKSVLTVVLEEPNVKRLCEADPIRLECGKNLPGFRFPDNVSLLIGYEHDHEELVSRMLGEPAQYLAWLERGRQWIEALDGLDKVHPLDQHPDEGIMAEGRTRVRE